ncbi:hypothetical protein LO772_05900 [Yinghuangia sp. ASG 101]|uniref:hypothetical protein n=1 Tax=Yinghuangia sp. ASG 101 TaxID=2896848 RepID=UPI001E3E62E1|nr:hypothetical protein [Yinghuangia sp. ASG 101]UGQ13149.1 hypothetical protein LO772_05900 [Yinghuangia sp. ASG 101]
MRARGTRAARPSRAVRTSWIDYAGIAGIVRAGRRPGDGIVYSAVDQRLWHVDAGVEYYLRGEPRPRDILAGRTAEDRDDLWTYDCSAPAACLDAADADRVRLVAVVPRGTPVDPFTALLPSTAEELRARYHVVRGTAVAGAYVSLLERGPTPPGTACGGNGRTPERRWAPRGEDRCAAGDRAGGPA